MNDTASRVLSVPTDRVTTYDGTNHPLHNNRLITDYAFSRERSPSRGVTSEREFNDAHYGAPVFGYTIRSYQVTDPGGHPMDVVEFIKELSNPAAEADKRLILDTDAPAPERLAAFQRHNDRASGDLVEPATWMRHHLYVVEYFTRTSCITHPAHYAQRYASVIDPEGGTETITSPYCGECMYHLRRSADNSGMETHESPALRIGQHD